MENKNKQQLFLEAYEAHNDAIFRYCYYQTSNREVALDLTQDTFLRTWEYLGKNIPVENVRALLYRIARNLVIDYRRKKKSGSLDTLIENGLDFGHDERHTHEERFDVEEARELLNHLDDPYREVMLLRYVEDFEVSEIAQMLEEPPNTISVRIHRAIEKLRTIIKDKHLR